jgi:MFS family permease
MAYQVPKFIEEETKLMGLITFNQLWILLSFAGLLIILFALLQFWLWIILFAIITPLGLFVTFGKVNNLPVYNFIMSAILHFWLPKHYLWQKEMIAPTSSKNIPQKIISTSETSNKKILDKKTLDQLTNILDK